MPNISIDTDDETFVSAYQIALQYLILLLILVQKHLLCASN